MNYYSHAKCPDTRRPLVYTANGKRACVPRILIKLVSTKSGRSRALKGVRYK